MRNGFYFFLIKLHFPNAQPLGRDVGKVDVAAKLHQQFAPAIEEDGLFYRERSSGVFDRHQFALLIADHKPTAPSKKEEQGHLIFPVVRVEIVVPTPRGANSAV